MDAEFFLDWVDYQEEVDLENIVVVDEVPEDPVPFDLNEYVIIDECSGDEEVEDLKVIIEEPTLQVKLELGCSRSVHYGKCQ